MAQLRSTGRSWTLVACATLLAGSFLAAGASRNPAVASAPAAEVYQGTPLETSEQLQAAPRVTSGVYVVHAPAAGQIGYFEIPRTVDGSNLWVGATVDLGPTASGEPLDGGLRVSGFASYWAASQGGAVTRPELQNAPPDASEFGLDLRDRPATAAIATPVVNWRDRELERGTFGLDQTGMPGTYYFVVHLRSGLSKGVDSTFQSCYFSDHAVGAPDHEPNPPVIPEVATFEDDGVDEVDPSSTDSDADDVPWPIVLMLFGGGAIFGVIGVVALNRSRRGRRP
jgi:hypothetical protein